jgi:hypothetical protein
MKYLKISPIIKPLHNRVYFTPRSDTQANNNEVKNKNKNNNNNKNINLIIYLNLIKKIILLI